MGKRRVLALVVAGIIGTSVASIAPAAACEDQGCTPGYWKQAQHFDSWVGYAPTQMFDSIFRYRGGQIVEDPIFPGMTLLQVLEQGGGGLSALGRHTVAALLNASGFPSDYLYHSTGAVIYDFQVYWDGTADMTPKQAREWLKNRFEAANELGCPFD